MDADRLAAQFLRTVRAARSQVALARRLGYRGNPIADWEAGRRVPTAAVALRACTISGIDVASAFAQFHPGAAPALGDGDADGVAAWLDALRGTRTIGALAERVGRSRSSVSRWFSGHSHLQLTDFFQVVEAITGRVSDLVAHLVDIESIDELRHEHRARQSAKALAYEWPWTEAILRVIETTAYRAHPVHPVGWIAAQLGIDTQTEIECIEALAEAGVLEQVDGLYVSGSLSVDTVGTEAQMNGQKAHWTKVALRRLEAPRAEDVFSYNVMSLSREALADVDSVLRRAYREIRSIAAAGQVEEVVAHVNLQLISFGGDVGDVEHCASDDEGAALQPK